MFGFLKTFITPMQKILPTTFLVLMTVVSNAFLTGCNSPNSEHATAVAPTASAAIMQPATLSGSAIRIKAGSSSSFTDSSGNVWQADQGFADGDTIDRDSSTAIANTKDPGLFLCEHYGMTAFSLKVPNGKYVAKLYFAETYDGVSGPGQRVFSFNVQGHEFKDFDVWAKAGGPNTAYVETVPVVITNEIFRIDFTSNIENPEINAIEIIPQP
jgi:hypothetical protein